MSNTHRRFFLRLAASLGGVFVIAGQVMATTITLETTLSTSEQSMWGAGEAVERAYMMPLISGVGWGSRAAPLPFGAGNTRSLSTQERVVVNPTWLKWQTQNRLHNLSCFTILGQQRCRLPKPSGPAPVQKITIPAVDLGTYGVEFSGSTHGRFGLDFEAEFQSGQVSINLPVEVQFDFDRTKVIPGQTFMLHSFGQVSPDAVLDTLSPTAEARLMLNSDMQFDSTGTIYTGPAGSQEVTIIPDMNVEDRHEILAVGTDGLKLFDTPLDELAGTALEKAGDFVVGKVVGQLEESKRRIAESELAKLRLKSAEKDLQNADKELDAAKAAERQNEENIALKEKALNDSQNAAANADVETATNKARIEEIDAMGTSGLSDHEKNALATEKSGLAARNARLDSRKQALSNQVSTLQQDIDAAKEKDKQLKKDTYDKSVKRTTAKDARDVKKEDSDKKKNELVKNAKSTKKRDILGSVLKVIDADFTVPVVETQGGADFDGAGVTLNSTGEAQFLEVKLDVDQLLSVIAKTGIAGAVTAGTAGTGAAVGAAAAKLLPSLSGEYSVADAFQAEYATLDLGLGVRTFASQAFEFTPEFEVVLDTGTGVPMAFDLGESVEITVPDSPGEFVLNPYLRVKGGTDNFTNSTGIRIEPFAELAVLGVTASLGLEAIGDFGLTAGPLVGSIQTNENGVDDLIPNDYPLDILPVIEIGALSGSWEMGGFGVRSLGAITLESAPLTMIPGGGFDSADGWNSFGSVVIEDGAAKLTTTSPVSIATLLDTPSAPFSLLYDYRFIDSMGGTLDVFLDSVLIDSVAAVSSSTFQTRSVYLDDPGFYGMAGLPLEFEYFDQTGAELYLDNIRISGVASVRSVTAPAVVPAPSTLLLFSAAALFVRRRSTWLAHRSGRPRTPRRRRPEDSAVQSRMFIHHWTP
jgi:hypothetical protein